MPDTNLQNSPDFKGQNFYVGLDVHKKSWVVTVRSLNKQVAHFTQPPCAETLVRTLQRKFPGGSFVSAYEAGFCGTTHHELLCKLGFKNIVVHAADVPSTDKQKKNKTDVHDSRSIAYNLEKDELEGIHILTREQQELRSLFRLREGIVKDVTRANNRLKSFLFYHGIEVPEAITKTEFISKRVFNWLGNIELTSDAGGLCLKKHTETLQYQRTQLFKVTKLLHREVQNKHKDAYARLLSVPGIGAITAMGLLAEIADFTRFKDTRQFSSYLGLTPWDDSSGETIRTKGIQPRCNTHLRPLIVEASWIAIRKSPELFKYYSKHAVKSNKHAIIKVAHKLALIAKAAVIKNQDYQADYFKKTQNENSNNEKRKVFLA